MISLSLIGLGIIVVSWIIQFFSMKKTKKIYLYFVIVYAIGVAVLVYDGFNSGLNDLAVANLFSLLASVLVLGKILKK